MNNSYSCVDAITHVPIDINGIQCISGGYSHSVMIIEGKIFAAGDDSDFRIGSNS